MSIVPQVGFVELVVVAVIALIVVGPKDLPHLMRMAGRAMAQARRLAGEFTAAFEEMARETEMQELREEIENLKKENPVAQAKRDLDAAMAPVDRALRDEAAEVQDAINKPVSKSSAIAPDKLTAENLGPETPVPEKPASARAASDTE